MINYRSLIFWIFIIWLSLSFQFYFLSSFRAYFSFDLILLILIFFGLRFGFIFALPLSIILGYINDLVGGESHFIHLLSFFLIFLFGAILEKFLENQYLGTKFISGQILILSYTLVFNVINFLFHQPLYYGLIISKWLINAIVFSLIFSLIYFLKNASLSRQKR